MAGFVPALIATAILPWVNGHPSGGSQLNQTGFTDPTTHTSVGGSTYCVSGMVQVVTNTTSNINFEYDLPQNQSQVTQAMISLWSAGSNFPKSSGTQQVHGTYNIGTTLCLPQGKRPTKVQLLTHGIGFDRSYWDFAPGYSYVDVAASAGYATFLYDRLGVGSSSKEDPIHTIQSPLELEILNVLAEKLRHGAFGGLAFSQVVGVGHSFGSALTQGLTAKYPQAVDAAVLTGFSVNGSGMATFNLGQNPTIASIDQPYRFSGLSNGYLVVASSIANQQTFFHAPGFDPTILSLADATKGTVTIGELFTTGLTVKPALNFHGPLAIVTGHGDLGFCFGNCSYPVNLLDEAVSTLYASLPANKTATFSVPDTGHGVNLHYSAGSAFEYIQNFLLKKGI